MSHNCRKLHCIYRDESGSPIRARGVTAEEVCQDQALASDQAAGVHVLYA